MGSYTLSNKAYFALKSLLLYWPSEDDGKNPKQYSAYFGVPSLFKIVLIWYLQHLFSLIIELIFCSLLLLIIIGNIPGQHV